MRFYSKITAAFWINIATALVWIYLGFFGHSHIYRFTSFIWLFILLSMLLLQVFSYWEVHADGLYERRLWATRTIPFAEIVRIAPSRLGSKPRSGWFNIDFFRPGPLSDRGTLAVTPAYPDRFLAALRHAAPQATFDI